MPAIASTTAPGHETVGRTTRSVTSWAGSPVSAARPPGRNLSPSTQPDPRSVTSKRRVTTPVTTTGEPATTSGRVSPRSTVSEQLGWGSTWESCSWPSARSQRRHQKYSAHGRTAGSHATRVVSTKRASSRGSSTPAVVVVGVAFVQSAMAEA